MTIEAAEKLARDLIKEHLGSSSHYWTFKWTHAKKSFGTCSVSGNIWSGIAYKIKLSKPLTLLNDEARVRNTILHEIAHALQWNISSYMSHDSEWVRIAKSIGCDGERCYNSDEVNKPKGKYTLSCGTCGNSTQKSRRPKRLFSCGKCCNAHNDGKFSEDYLMVLKEN